MRRPVCLAVFCLTALLLPLAPDFALAQYELGTFLLVSRLGSRASQIFASGSWQYR